MSITEAQKEAFSKVKDILEEHFDDFVFIVETEISNAGTDKSNEYVCWNASCLNKAHAIGLMERYKAELIAESLSINKS